MGNSHWVGREGMRT